MKTAGFFLFLVILVIVVLQNTEVVTFRFLFWNISMSRVILYPGVFLLGAATGWFLGWLKRNRST